MKKLERNVSGPCSQLFWEKVEASARSLSDQPRWVSAGVYLGPPTNDELPMTQETKQCRHIKSGMLVASTTIRHESIAGRTLAGGSTAEFLSTTELCGMCSGIIIATLQHLEADDEAQQQTFGRVLDAVGEMRSTEAPKITDA